MTPAPVLPPSPRDRATSAHRVARFTLACALLLALAVPSVLLAGGAAPGAPAWSGETLGTASTLPVQDGGRVMPLHTYAGFTLLKLNHKRTAKDAADHTLPPIAVLLDLLFRPRVAIEYPIFVVDDAAVLDTVGLQHAGKDKRDRYSYAELEPGRDALFRLAKSYRVLPAENRTAVQGGVVDLVQNLRLFESLGSYLGFSRGTFEVSKFPGAEPFFGTATQLGYLDVLRRAKDLLALAAGTDAAAAGARGLLEAAQAEAGASSALALLPPTGSREEDGTWLTPSDVAVAALSGRPVDERHLDILAQLEKVSSATDDPAAFERELRILDERIGALAGPRGELRKLGLEVFLARFDPFYNALYGYILAFLLLALSWVVRSRWIVRGALAVITLALAVHVTGIVLRCILQSRPPVKTLYETTLFISAFGVAGALVVERLNPRGIALSLAPVLGAIGLFIANRYEVIRGEDTMPQLVAVLDTNFWLATHVVCVTIGYGASLLAAVIAHVHVGGRVLGLKKGDPSFYREVSRMVYGVLCFGLLFSTVGTILGGIWANESWGRFWGWDPKENGALMIVLVQLAILHSRLGGILKPLGISIAAIFCGCVVAFSWWGINLLGIGLHSYGFTAGLWTALGLFWGLEALVIGAGIARGVLDRAGAAASRA